MEKTTTIILLVAKLMALTTFACGQALYLPEDLQKFFEQEKIKSPFEINATMNPFYLRGDFDGDKKPDYAITISERKTGKKGIIIYHTKSKKYFVIGAGQELSTRPSDDYGWIDAWEVFCKRDPQIGVGESETVKLKGEAILVQKLESSSGIIYWDGERYQWYQQGD